MTKDHEKKTRRMKAIVAYDGTAFSGWQVQGDKRTVQAEVERAITEITGESPRIFCSGRTDSGVHAIGQVVHFEIAAKIPAQLKRIVVD